MVLLGSLEITDRNEVNRETTHGGTLFLIDIPRGTLEITFIENFLL
jgi:hypothetical protein